MDKKTLEGSVRVIIDDRQLKATVRINPGVDPEYLDPDTIRALLIERGVKRDKIDDDGLARFIDTYDPDSDEPAQAVLAVGTPPTQGVDAGFEWLESIAETLSNAERKRAATPDLSEQEPDTDGAEIETNPDQPPGEAVCHYDRSAYCTVQKGELLGTVIPAEPAVDGVNLFGESIAGKQPVTEPLRHDGTLVITDDGEIRAGIAGILSPRGDGFVIDKVLRIPGSIDFSTGNLVGFRGDVEVVKGVKDNFHLEINGNLTIGDLVEAAHVASAQNVHLRRGMAGREKGTIDVGGDLKTRFLDGVSGSVLRDLEFRAELTNCRLKVGRDIKGDSGAIVGGELEVMGRCTAAQIGSPSGATQRITLGKKRDIEQLAARAAGLIPKLKREHDKLQEGFSMLTESTTKLTAAQAEEVTHLQLQLAISEGKLKPLAGYLRKMLEVLDAVSQPALIAQRVIHAGVVVEIGNYSVSVNTDIRGPVRLELEPNSGSLRLVELPSERATDLLGLARVVRTDEVVDLTALTGFCAEVLGPAA